ncbi:hypothetical protein [Nonomuraea sp. NPDC003214]
MAISTAASLYDAYGTADAAYKRARKIATTRKGDVAAYASLREAATQARENYDRWAEAMGRDAIAIEIRDLGRIIRTYLDTLDDACIYALAVANGFPAEGVTNVSANSLRYVLNAAYPDDLPTKKHIAAVALDPSLRLHPTAHRGEPSPILGILYVLLTTPED